MPAEGLPWLEREDILSFEEIQRLVALLAAMGVHDVRLTGGEPLVRRNFPHLVKMLSDIEDVADLSLTTNGFLLERDAEALVRAGVKRFSVSVDSLQRDRFFEMTRRHGFRFADGRGKIGFINPVSEPFCADCNRIRITADGRLRTCLFSLNETDLRTVMRSGADDGELERRIRDAVWRKELKHRVGERASSSRRGRCPRSAARWAV